VSNPAPALSAHPAVPLAPKAVPQREQLAKAAKQFEAIFVRQMLAAARAAKPACENDLFGGQAMETFAQMRDERFAEIAANSGAFGVARAIEVQLGAHMQPASLAEVARASAHPQPLPPAGGEKGHPKIAVRSAD